MIIYEMSKISKLEYLRYVGFILKNIKNNFTFRNNGVIICSGRKRS